MIEAEEPVEWLGLKKLGLSSKVGCRIRLDNQTQIEQNLVDAKTIIRDVNDDKQAGKETDPSQRRRAEESRNDAGEFVGGCKRELNTANREINAQSAMA